MLDEATGRWGIRVNRVELKSVEPPRTVQEAMEKQMRAERDRRATILTAEGVKQSQILTAEGEKQSAVLRAEGARTAAILKAEGEAKAIETVFGAIHDGAPDQALLSYQYLQMLPQLAQGDAEQGLRDPVGVLAGARQPRRRARRARRRGQPARAPASPNGPAAEPGAARSSRGRTTPSRHRRAGGRRRPGGGPGRRRRGARGLPGEHAGVPSRCRPGSAWRTARTDRE